MSVFDLHARLTARPGAARRLLSAMDESGIARAGVAAGGVVSLDQLSESIVEGGHATVSADNDAVQAACAASGGRLLPFWFANPHQDAGEYKRRAGEFRGLELSPAVHGIGFDDPRTAAYVEVAADAGHPVYVVCLGRPGAHVADLVTLARKYPGTTFVSGHCGHIGVDAHGLALVAAQPNVVAETSGCFAVIVEMAIDRLGPDRVLFGTEYPLQHPQVELAKLASLRLSPDIWAQVTWRNAHRLLGEELS
jgi:predicted TIM-barrel fold metal-dependent hydrolase